MNKSNPYATKYDDALKRLNAYKKKHNNPEMITNLEQEVNKNHRLAVIYDILIFTKQMNPRIDWDMFKYLFETELISWRCYISTTNNNNARIEDIRRQIKESNTENNSFYDHIVAIIVTSKSAKEDNAIETAQSLVDSIPDISTDISLGIIEGRDETLGNKMSLYLICSRQINSLEKIHPATK